MSDIKKPIQSFLIIILFLSTACSDKSASEHVPYAKSEKDTCIGKVSMHLKRAKLNYVDIKLKPDTLLVFNKSGYVLLPKECELEWFCGKHTGVVQMKGGTFKTENKQLIGGKFLVNMDSIYDVDIDNNLMRGTLENILRSADFFEVKKYSVAVFKINNVAQVSGNLFKISGNLKIKNTERQIEFNNLFDISSDTLFVQSEKFTIDRTDWGINHMSKKYMKDKGEFVFTDSLQFIVHLKAAAE